MNLRKILLAPVLLAFFIGMAAEAAPAADTPKKKSAELRSNEAGEP